MISMALTPEAEILALKYRIADAAEEEAAAHDRMEHERELWSRAARERERLQKRLGALRGPTKVGPLTAEQRASLDF